jgi:hypothetical protein
MKSTIKGALSDYPVTRCERALSIPINVLRAGVPVAAATAAAWGLVWVMLRLVLLLPGAYPPIIGYGTLCAIGAWVLFLTGRWIWRGEPC